MREIVNDRVNEIETTAHDAAKDIVIADLQKKLEQANQKFEILSKATYDAIWDWDLQTNLIEWNHGLKTLFGYDEKKSAHNYCTWADNIHPQDKDEVLNGVKAAIDTGKLNWSAMYRYRCFNGIYKYTYDRGYIVYEGNMPVRMIGAMQDIDERMTGIEEIEKLSLVASKTENLVVITDADEKIEWVNEGFIKRTGYTLKEIIGKTPRLLQGPETDKAALDRIRKNIAARKSVTEEILNYTKDGRKFWIKININPVFDDAHNLIRLIAVETDITLHKEYESKITSIARELSDLIENANAVIFGVDKNGCVNEWNKQATTATGYDRRDVLDQKLTRFVIGADRQEKLEKYINYVLAGNVISLKELEIRNHNGGMDTLLLSATPRKNAAGEIVGLIAVGQDITELTEYRYSLEEKVKERTLELKIALEKETELAAMKGRFASIVSHEFRTPLSIINLSMGQIKKYKNRMPPEDIDRKIDVVLKQVDRMSDLLEDVLTLGKTESGKILINKIKIDLPAFIQSVKEQVESVFAHSHTIHCTLSITHAEIETDDNLMRNIFINLLNNAIKFSPGKQSVQLTISETQHHFLFEIKDEGMGIPEAELNKVFEAFDRGSNAGVISGTGLGLFIVKKAVILLGGDISVSSRQDQGSVFSVRLPKK